MGEVGEGFAALSEAVVFLNHFKDLPDQRQLGKVIYPLHEVLLLCLLAVLAGAEDFVVECSLDRHSRRRRQRREASRQAQAAAA
jgi:hypothetical protein